MNPAHEGSVNFAKEARVYVAGGDTLIGAAIARALERQGYHNTVGSGMRALDLNCAGEVDAFFAAYRPQIVFLAAGKMGGIGANQRYPADLMLDNLRVQSNVIESAHRNGVARLLYLASSCVYPKLCPQPMREESLFTGPLEPTNAAYAMAKLSGITLCQAFRKQHGADFLCGIPANIYGPGDHFDPENAHVIGALITRLHQAKTENTPAVEVWGSGNAQREFLYVDDLADACLFVMRSYEGEEPINLGGGTVASIRELACMIREIVGYEGELRFDATKPDGFALKALDSTRLTALGWRGHTTLHAGLEHTYRWFLDHDCPEEIQVEEIEIMTATYPELRKDLTYLKARAAHLRATCVQMAHDGREGHLSSALSCMDVLVALYHHWLRVYPDAPRHPERDRFILSKGHGCTALYAVLADCGCIPKEWLARYAHEESPLPNHPCVHALPPLEYSSGSLGHGLGVATGMAYTLRLDRNPARAVALLGDGECNEGSVWEAAMFAAANRLDNVLAIVDNNNVQAVGRSDALTGYTSLEEKFRAFGWAARTIDGNDMDAVLQALAGFPFEAGRPSAIIAKTRGGAGVSFMEDDVLWHYRVPSDEDLRRALDELDAPPIHLTDPINNPISREQ